MGLFSFMETSFFFTLGISFLLILLLVYHFKQRLVLTEQKQDTMFEIMNNLVQEITQVKRTIALMHRPPTPYPTNERREFPITQLNIHEEDEEEEEEEEEDYDEEDLYSLEDSDDESIDSNERIVVSDENDDDVDDLNAHSIIEPIQESTDEVEEPENKTEAKPNFSKMTLATLKEYIITKGWVEDATKLKKAQILSIIQENEG